MSRQENALTDRRIVVIKGYIFQSQIEVGEGGYDMDSVEAPEPGVTALLATGQKKMKAIPIIMLTKRNSPDRLYLKQWEDDGGHARDIQVYYTDKDGTIENAYKCITYVDSELSSVVEQVANVGTPESAKVTFTILPANIEKDEF